MGGRVKLSQKARQLHRLLSTNATGKGSGPSMPRQGATNKGSTAAGQTPTPAKPGPEPLKDVGQTSAGGQGKKTPTFTGESTGKASGTPNPGITPPPLGKPIAPGSKTPPLAGPAPPGSIPLSSGGPTSKSNAWLLSPKIPIDVRLLAGGLLLVGGYFTYSYIYKEEEAGELEVPKEIGFETARVLEDEDRAGHSLHGSGDQNSFYTDEIAADASDLGSFEIVEMPGPSDNAEPSSGSEHEGLVSNTEALTGSHPTSKIADANALLQEDLEALTRAQEQNDPRAQEVADLLGSVFASPKLNEQQLEDVADKASALKGEASIDNRQEESQAESSGTSALKAEAKKKLHQMSETLEAVKGGMAGDAAEAMLSSHFQAHTSKKHGNKDQSEAASAEASSSETAGIDQTLGNSEDVSQSENLQSRSQLYDHLGIHEDLRPAALVRKAIERGEGGGDNWQEYRPRLLQAEADARSFKAALQQALQHLNEKDAASQADVQRLESSVLDLKKRLRDNAVAYKQAMQEQDALAEGIKEGELQRQAEFLATAYAEAAVKERTIRSSQLDQIRQHLNSLSQAFDQRSTAAKNSHSIHKVSLGTFALATALEEGLPFANQAASLKKSCPEDNLISAVVTTLPHTAAAQGVETQAELIEEWPDTSRSLRQLSYLSPGKANLVALGLASLAARLKVKESPDSSKIAGIDQALAHADQKLVHGCLSEAADLIEQGAKGTAGEIVAAEYASKLRARATIEQSVKLLKAHASSSVASLS